jgi:hypothetical protein
MPRAASEPVLGRSDVQALLRFAQVLPLASLVVALVGVLRLGRQFPAAASSPALLVPFLLPVLALALEAGALVAFSASALRLYGGLSLRPVATRARALLPLAAAVALVFGLTQALPRGTERPGAFANDLIESARGSCGETGSVPVPLLGLKVRCDQGRRIEGPMPGVPGVQLQLKSLAFSDDLRSVHITELELQARRSLAVRLRAGTARISGLSPWARSVRLSPALRFVMLTGVALGLGVAAAAVWRPATDASLRAWQRAGRVLVAALPGVVAALVVVALDQEQARPLAYVSSAAAAIAALLALALLRRPAEKLFSSFKGF